MCWVHYERRQLTMVHSEFLNPPQYLEVDDHQYDKHDNVVGTNHPAIECYQPSDLKKVSCSWLK